MLSMRPLGKCSPQSLQRCEYLFRGVSVGKKEEAAHRTLHPRGLDSTRLDNLPIRVVRQLISTLEELSDDWVRSTTHVFDDSLSGSRDGLSSSAFFVFLFYGARDTRATRWVQSSIRWRLRKICRCKVSPPFSASGDVLQVKAKAVGEATGYRDREQGVDQSLNPC